MKQFISTNPATSEVIWQGSITSLEEIDNCFQKAKIIFSEWSNKIFEERYYYLKSFIDLLEQERKGFEEIIAKETGKTLWEARGEVDSMISKLPISVEAYKQRTGENENNTDGVMTRITHKPHGVLAVIGPFNFPAHLPNGHIIPALLAGNVVIFKPSPLTPWVGEKMCQLWQRAGLPKNVLQLVQGGSDIGKYLSNHTALNGLLFTGSYPTGQSIARSFAETPEKILALELGGNNPLVIDIDDESLLEAAVYQTIYSAYITTGQRCTCARRLILINQKTNRLFLEKLVAAIPKIQMGPYSIQPEPFMGPLINDEAATRVLENYQKLCHMGADIIVPLQHMKLTKAFLTPGLIDVTDVNNIPDEEIFGPLLKIQWVKNMETAIMEANNTEYGLIAGIFTADQKKYHQFFKNVNAGLINWNRPLTGASSKAPFGGIKHSGNHRPSAWYAADYCAYPVASLEEITLTLPKNTMPGLSI